MSDEQQLRSLPSVDALLGNPAMFALRQLYGSDLIAYAARQAVAHARKEAHDGRALESIEQILAQSAEIVKRIALPSLKRVVNATGVVLHTNLGRAPLGSAVLDDIAPIVSGYSNLEFDLATGKRGRRDDHCRELLQYLTGAEDVLVVNNNAAALVLALHTLARRREVIVSRGELVEIGGAFRIPEIMKSAGARMVEVGTTNRTRLSDYETAVTPKTALLFKAHKSNYTISGFTQEVPIAELAAWAKSTALPLLYDLGSGLLRKPGSGPVQQEPDVRSALEDGADLVAFSCDKLLGGPQAGIIAGRAELIRRLSRAPLMRALRVGKLTIAALYSACRHYLTDAALNSKNPAFAMFAADCDCVRQRAESLMRQLAERGIAATVVESLGQCGGGSLPNARLQSAAVCLMAPEGLSARQRERFAERVYQALMQLDWPVVAILREGKLLFDVLTLLDEEMAYLPAAVAEALAKQGGNRP